jgi:hypothetical protein
VSATRDRDRFLARAASALRRGPACARGVFLVAPDGFGRPSETARDNLYMSSAPVELARAHAEHAGLARALAARMPTVVFPGDPEAPDGVFPNNAFATVPGRLIVGRMRWPVRRRETARTDIRRFFTELLGYREIDLSRRDELTAELTGSLVIDRARRIGYCGLSERCDEAGARAMHEAFGLAATFVFPLAPGEYHANVVMSSLAGRALLIAPSGFADPADADCVIAAHGGAVVILDEAQKRAFAANAIALDPETVWMSERAAGALTAAQARQLERAGFRILAMPLAELEKGGGSLRCLVAEIF